MDVCKGPLGWPLLVLTLALFGLSVGPAVRAQSVDRIASGDTVRPVEPVALWKSPAAVVLVSSVSPQLSLAVEEVREEMVAVSAGDQRGWIRKEAFRKDAGSGRSVSVWASEPSPFASRPLWRFPLARSRRSVRLDRLLVYESGRGGISVSTLISNVSRSTAIKYMFLTLELQRATADSLSETSAPLRTVRAIGPIEPGTTASFAFRNVWVGVSGSCVTVRRVGGIHLDGSRFVFPSPLRRRSRASSIFSFPSDCLSRSRSRP